MTDEELAKLVAADTLGLLDVKLRPNAEADEAERVAENFAEIARFVDEAGMPPSKDGATLRERRLHARLCAMRQNAEVRSRLKALDRHGLLRETAPPGQHPASIEDVLNDEFLKLLSPVEGDIYKLAHVPERIDVDGPDYVAQRKPCRDFAVFEKRLVQCQLELKDGRRRLLPVANDRQPQIEAGRFFVLRGILLLVAQVGVATEKNGRWNARLRCVFENGTESDMLQRSLSSELYKDGRLVTELFDDQVKSLVVTDADQAAGYIYVLRSLSEDAEVRAIPDLYKIGLARSSIQERIRNASREPTYLMAPVIVVATFQCYNLNLRTLENLLHRFFAAAVVAIRVSDKLGNTCTPKEWFSVPLDAIEAAVRLLMSGEIVKYSYDPGRRRIVVRE